LLIRGFPAILSVMLNLEKKRLRTRTRMWFGAIFAVFLLTYPATAHPANPILIGSVGSSKARHHNAYIITLKFPDGKLVRSIPAGTYTFVIHDYSRIHNFALGSQTDNKRLFTGGIRSTGTKKYVLTLAPGSYAYACSAHFQTMNGTFIVTAPPGP
jgi:plastocyanin